MAKPPEKVEVPTRDQLASIRTHLANERTLLAYVRTSLAFLAAGSGLIVFLSSWQARLGGRLLIGIGVAIIAVGVSRFFGFRRRIKSIGS